ncbi:MAG: polyphosphate polymerase domain-containing protein [Planctomycetes bacterium]|nr:polyphosphate polymerase domain-containing protein [Planctomycetota bacterium]
MTYRNRHECKFVVPETVAARVRQQLRPYVVPDPFAAGHPDHSYRISSLYLDDAAGTLYRETVEGRAQRFKLRVRAYDDLPDSPIFLEVKRRHDRVVQKLRCPLRRRDLPAVLAGHIEAELELPAHQRQSLREFVRLQQLRRAMPRLLVRYQRQAYVGLDDDDARITFDRALSASSETAPIVRQGGRFETVPVRGVILELKFTDRYPRWMAAVVRGCELRRGSFSKYCRSADALADRGHVIAL